MRIIYLDSDFKCHTNDAQDLIAIETDFFDDKCDAFIEGYRFVPHGETWQRNDGTIFIGEMIAPWKDFNILLAHQEEYEILQMGLIKAYREGIDSI